MQQNLAEDVFMLLTEAQVCALLGEPVRGAEDGRLIIALGEDEFIKDVADQIESATNTDDLVAVLVRVLTAAVAVQVDNGPVSDPEPALREALDLIFRVTDATDQTMGEACDRIGVPIRG